MKTKLTLLTLITLLFTSGLSAIAGIQLSDAAIKQKLIGYWGGPRWAVLYKSDGIKYPVSTNSLTSHWDVKDGTYYEDSIPCDILVLTDKKFVYRFRGGETVSYVKISKKQAEQTGWR